MRFTTIDLASDQVLVEGTDVRGNDGSVVLNAAQWNRIKRDRAIAGAHEQFDDKVAEFFAELTEAAAELETAHRVELDPMLYIVEQEGQEGTAPVRERVTELDRASVVLRAIEQGNTDRLIWVGGNLVVTAKPVTSPTAGAGETEAGPAEDALPFDVRDEPVTGETPDPQA